MNLEAIEQRTLRYLKQVTNPLVPLHVLTSHLRQDPECADFGDRELVEFLRDHELFRVMEPPDPTPGGESEDDYYVILDTRVPPPAELAERMNQELTKMTDALTNALDQARQQGNEQEAQQINALIARTEELHKKIQPSEGQ